MERREEMRRWLAEREREGLTYRELSQRAGVAANTLAHWAWRLRRGEGKPTASAAPNFVELVPSAAPSDTPGSRVEIVTRSERRVIVDAGIDSAALARILIAVERC
jgi:transposase-like protein